MKFSEMLAHPIQGLKTLFLSGLFTIIPIAATLFFINFLYGLFTKALGPLRSLEPDVLQRIPGSEFVLVTLLILTTGIVLKVFIAHSIVTYFEHLISKIPLVRIVYSSAKIMVDFFKLPKTTKSIDSTKKKVVLIPYPKKGQYHIAFLLESAEENYEKLIPDSVRHYPGEKYYKVFMPNSPNPTLGYFFIMPADDIIHTTITFEEAIKALASCGLITPTSLISPSNPPSKPL